MIGGGEGTHFISTMQDIAVIVKKTEQDLLEFFLLRHNVP